MMLRKPISRLRNGSTKIVWMISIVFSESRFYTGRTRRPPRVGSAIPVQQCAAMRLAHVVVNPPGQIANNLGQSDKIRKGALRGTSHDPATGFVGKPKLAQAKGEPKDD